MSTVTNDSAAQAAWRRLHDHLDAIRKETGAELLAYPQPATECDLHYRDLLERRRAVNAELCALRERPAPAEPDPAWRAWLAEWLRSSAFADDGLKGEIARLMDSREDAI